MKSWVNAREECVVHPPRHQTEKSGRWVFSIVLKLVVTLGIVSFFSFKRISYNDHSAQISRKISCLKKDIHLKERAIANWRMQKEHLMDYRYLKGKNESLRLGLRPASPSQVHHVALLQNPNAENFVAPVERRTASR